MPVYLLHFDEKYSHAQHYCGYADDVQARLAEHQNGRGSKLTRAAAKAGRTFQVAQTWPGDRNTERAMKGRPHGSSTSWRKRCVVCKAGRAQVTQE